ncbi:hypothetical protein L9F63_009522 [Diploptera punctata]|uniref:Uncharacterized protein n=1 Tax=Diploptera punctata TaxID=6984 RepID=A0AAD8AM38_DIPPU|nr:hypothetical protein L9F63_009522 [Diploptera punctata]
MAAVVKFTNFIKGGHHFLTHRKFVSFFEEIDTAYGDLLLHQMFKVDNSYHFCCKQLYEEEKVSFKKYVQFVEDLILEFVGRFQVRTNWVSGIRPKFTIRSYT